MDQKREIWKLQREQKGERAHIHKQDAELKSLRGRVCELKNDCSCEKRQLLDEMACKEGDIDKLKDQLARIADEAVREQRALHQQIDYKDKQIVTLDAEMVSMEEEAVQKGLELQQTVAWKDDQISKLHARIAQVENEVIGQLKKELKAVQLEKEDNAESHYEIIKDRQQQFNKLKIAHDELENKLDAHDTRLKKVERLESMVEALGFDKDGDDFYFYLEGDDEDSIPIELCTNEQLERVSGTRVSLKHRDKAVANLRNQLTDKTRQLAQTTRKLNMKTHDLDFMIESNEMVKEQLRRENPHLKDEVTRLSTRVTELTSSYNGLRLMLRATKENLRRAQEARSSLQAGPTTQRTSATGTLQDDGVGPWSNGFTQLPRGQDCSKVRRATDEFARFTLITS